MYSIYASMYSIALIAPHMLHCIDCIAQLGFGCFKQLVRRGPRSSITVWDPCAHFECVVRRLAMLNSWKRFMTLAPYVDVDLTPKAHQMLHATVRQAISGNLWYHNCFLDESLNKVLKTVCRNCPQNNSEIELYTKVTIALRKNNNKRSARP